MYLFIDSIEMKSELSINLSAVMSLRLDILVEATSSHGTWRGSSQAPATNVRPRVGAPQVVGKTLNLKVNKQTIRTATNYFFHH